MRLPRRILVPALSLTVLAIAGIARIAGATGAAPRAPSAATARFHDRENLSCSACHPMGGGSSAATPSASARFSRLSARETTTLCLSCHDGESDQYPNAPDVFRVGAEPELPAGDLAWAAANPANGHNVGGIAGTDAALSLSPGGNFPAANLTCTSCHDPHGGGGGTSFEYRNLLARVNGVDVSGAIESGEADEAILVVGATNAAVSPSNHNVYQGSFGAWCAACHSQPDNSGAGFHGADRMDPDTGDGASWLRHPTDTAIGAGCAANYNRVGTYDPAYPLIRVGGSWTRTTSGAVAASDRVFCLSCHEAHATRYANATRWNMEAPTGVGASCSRCHDL